ncbi:MAG TPA: CocE/NonD family hydrolase [Acidimicrobiales bacterium]|nr:CocE/NonD family hydrolase [Acidimicrobiales bacterium]
MPRTRISAAVIMVVSMVVMSLGRTASPASAASSPPIGGSLPAQVIAASAAAGTGWKPEPATYGIGQRTDVPVTAADGTVLSANVYYPTNASGQPAAGRFPVLLTQTPYGKGTLGSLPGSDGAQTGPDDYLVQRGYIDVVADVRGTGSSEGTFGLFDPAQVADGVTLVNWASRLPGSDGKVGLYGASYLGINQLLTAAAVGKNSPLKAIFPVVAANDIYKDTATMGGLIDIEFDLFYLGLTGGLNAEGPLLDALENPTNLVADLSVTELQHLADLGSFDAPFAAQTLEGMASAYDGAYWQARNPVNVLQRIVANGIPAYLVGGEYDLFQRGEPLNYAGLQNAYVGRPVTAPMLPDQPTTGRYQLLDGPFTHLSGATVDYGALQLEWFDTWLKGENTGMGQTPTPLHYYDLGTSSYREQARYPFPAATPTRFYFSGTRSSSPALSFNNGTLTTAAPTTTGADTMLWSPVGNPCGRPTDQWAAGALSLVTSFFAANAACVNNDLPGELGPDRLTYTTGPLAHAESIEGPIDATIFASATTKDTEWVAEVEDVAPDGTSTPLTEGALLGSLRALDPATTWTASNGQILQAGHTYTQTSARPVVPGQLTRYDVEVFPTYDTVAAGHRIRVTLATSDTPHLVPTVPELADLLGGIYTVQHSPGAASAIELPLAPAGS